MGFSKRCWSITFIFLLSVVFTYLYLYQSSKLNVIYQSWMDRLTNLSSRTWDREEIQVLNKSFLMPTNQSKSVRAETTIQACNTTQSSPPALVGTDYPKNRIFIPKTTCRHRQPQGTKKKLILNFNRQEWWFMGDKTYENAFKGCTYDACKLTDDRRLLSVADAVIVCVCRLGTNKPPPRHSSAQIWIAYGLESPVHYYGHHDSPSWKNVFNWTMGYRTDSDVFNPYNFLAVRSSPTMKNYTSIALKKTKPVAWFVSNCHTQSKRDEYVKQLRKHVDVDIYGGCGDKQCSRAKESECLKLLNTTYYFYLSLENSICQDYVTEKFFKVFNNIDVVPIVRGGANYSQYFPSNTFLNTADYRSPKDLAAHLKALMADPQAFARLLQIKDQFILNTEESKNQRVCALCEKLHTSGSEYKVYPDFMKWTREGICKKPSDI